MDGLTMGLGFTFALLMLGGMREVIGQGTLLANAHLLFGEVARDWTITLVSEYRGFLLAILPPGAFIGLGLLIAVKNLIDEKAKRPAPIVVGEAAAEH
jgi:electron transport complex protein RnfE